MEKITISKEDRHSIYSRALTLIVEAFDTGLGLCFYVQEGVESIFGRDLKYSYTYNHISKHAREEKGIDYLLYPEISKHEPANNKTDYWYLGSGAKFRQARIDILKQAIEETA